MVIAVSVKLITNISDEEIAILPVAIDILPIPLTPKSMLWIHNLAILLQIWERVIKISRALDFPHEEFRRAWED
jgi:hypothetical protein